MNKLVLNIANAAYEAGVKPLLFRRPAQEMHDLTMRLLGVADRSPVICKALAQLRHATTDQQPAMVGGVLLSSPLILAAGLVKGRGFASEGAALAAVRAGENILPGWRSVPAFAGPVEFGSFTPHPRMGNPGMVMWRDRRTRSTQNRVGLRNPGAEAAAAFLARHLRALPPQFGVNIAPSPGQNDAEISTGEVLHAIDAFRRHHIHPSWYTLNLSCPNTEDDPSGRQTETVSRDMCQAVVQYLSSGNSPTPLWVKLSPDLAPEQYRLLMHVFEETGVRGVVATNTIARPSPTGPATMAGVGGGALRPHALPVVRLLNCERERHGYAVDIIGCGGALDGTSYRAHKEAGAQAVQYWSALVYRGPLAAAVIAYEARCR